LNKGGEKGFVALTLATLLPLQPFEFETVSTIKEINYFRSAHWRNPRTPTPEWTVGGQSAALTLPPGNGV